MKLKDCSDNVKRKELVKEFYSSLPHRINHIPSSAELRSWIAAKQDICQVCKWHKLEYPVIWCWELSWGWSYCNWIYNYLCNQCLSPLKLWVQIPLRRGYLIQHYVIKFVSDLRQVSGFLWVLHFPPPIKLISAQILKFWKFFVMELIVTKDSGSIPAYFLYQFWRYARYWWYFD